MSKRGPKKRPGHGEKSEPPVRFELTTFCLRGRRINRFAKVALSSAALRHLTLTGVQQRPKYVVAWSIGVSIPVPRACKARTLPIELMPQGKQYSRRGSNPRPPAHKTGALPLSYWSRSVDVGRRNPWRGKPHALQNTKKCKTNAQRGARTPDPGLIRPMLYQLSYPSVGQKRGPSWESSQKRVRLGRAAGRFAPSRLDGRAV